MLPLALWHRGDDTALVRDAHDQSRVTHGHVTVQACCALYCLWAHRILEGVDEAWNATLGALRAIYQDQPAYRAALDYDIVPAAERTPRGSGFVIVACSAPRPRWPQGPVRWW